MWTSLMGSLPLLKSGRSVSVNWENRTGAKGAACQASSALGKSRKGSPCIPSIAAGETVTLAKLTGSGAIQHIWCTVTDATPKGRFVLRIWYCVCTGTVRKRPRWSVRWAISS